MQLNTWKCLHAKPCRAQVLLLAMGAVRAALRALRATSAVADVTEQRIEPLVRGRAAVGPVPPETPKLLPVVHILWAPLMHALKVRAFPALLPSSTRAGRCSAGEHAVTVAFLCGQLGTMQPATCCGLEAGFGERGSEAVHTWLRTRARLRWSMRWRSWPTTCSSAAATSWRAALGRRACPLHVRNRGPHALLVRLQGEVAHA